MGEQGRSLREGKEDWQAIETAPKGNGERVLLSLQYENDCLPRLTIEGANYDDDTWHWPGRKADSRYRPTHWMPLPKPPKAPAASERLPSPSSQEAKRG